MRSDLWKCLLFLVWGASATAHDIPNARVDRSIQATLEPGRIRIDYQVGLSELTLTQDLRQVSGELTGGDRQTWFETYGRLTGPLNARGVLVSVNNQDVELKAVGFDLTIEGHPLFTFHFVAEIPTRGRLTLNDTNYLASEGTSRLALKAGAGVQALGDDLPTDVAQIPIRPVWQLDNLEERRTRRLTVDYALTAQVAPPSSAMPVPVAAPPSTPENALSGLLDRASQTSWPILCLVAFGLGAAHAIQPGHGKTLVLANAFGPGSRAGRGAWLGLATAIVHLSSVALIAGLLWATRLVRPEPIHRALVELTGFLIAALGLWKVGRHLADYGEHEADPDLTPGFRGIFPLALAGGAVPCWDAVALVLVAEAIGRFRLGLILLAAFSLGMAAVLVALGVGGGRVRIWLDQSDRAEAWERGLGILGGLMLAVIGLSLLASGSAIFRHGSAEWMEERSGFKTST